MINDHYSATLQGFQHRVFCSRYSLIQLYQSCQTGLDSLKIQELVSPLVTSAITINKPHLFGQILDLISGVQCTYKPTSFGA